MSDPRTEQWLTLTAALNRTMREHVPREKHRRHLQVLHDSPWLTDCRLTSRATARRSRSSLGWRSILMAARSSWTMWWCCRSRSTRPRQFVLSSSTPSGWWTPSPSRMAALNRATLRKAAMWRSSPAQTTRASRSHASFERMRHGASMLPSPLLVWRRLLDVIDDERHLAVWTRRSSRS